MNRFFCICCLLIVAAPIAGQDIPLSKILVEKEGWRVVAKVPIPADCLFARADGSIMIYNTKLIATIDVAGKLTSDGDESDFGNNAIVAVKRTDRNHFYSVDGQKQVIFAGAAKRDTRLKLDGLTAPSCLTLWPDEGHLVIGESDGAYLWAVRIEKDGSFGPGDRYYSLRTKPGEKMHVSAMTMDAGYLLYACTPLGIQVFDPTGRLSGVVAAPSKEPMTAIAIGGANADELFVAAGGEIYARKIQGKASYTLKKSK